MWIITSLILFYLLVPILLICLTKVSGFLKRIGAVVLAYAVGLLFGNSGIIPAPGEKLTEILEGKRPFLPQDEFADFMNQPGFIDSDIVFNQVAQVQQSVMTYTILLALPLLLFSLDLKKWVMQARSALLSLILALVALLIAVISGYYWFAEEITDSAAVTGMLIGVYTGGTPNMAAIGKALNVSPDIFILTHTYDLIIGSVALLFLMTLAQKLFNTFLPRFTIRKAENIMQSPDESEDIDNFDGLFLRRNLPAIFKSMAVAIVIFGIGGGLSFFFKDESLRTIMVILVITTLGLLASLIKPLNRLKISFSVGMYFIIVFCLALSSMANLREMFSLEFLQLFLYVCWVVLGSIIIHVLLARLFKVDTDTTIITITALTYSPPFVPAVAGALKNKEVIISGLAIGIVGFAFGTYLGIFIGTILK
ncbi:MAG TPA: DUF819 family protein [Mariniphaga sp.]|nr:DUF819 family protein [Mariniphaga sp.]